MNSFSGLTDQLPSDILKQTRPYIGNAVALFKPRTYIHNLKIVNPDYHFVLPSTVPPPTFICNKEYKFRKNR